MKSTRDILTNHLTAFAQHDLQAILSDYAPDAVFFTRHGPLVGTAAIRPLFQALLAEFAKPGASFSLNQHVIEGNYAYILWNAETADNIYDLGTDTFFIRDGQIAAQSFTAEITSKAG